MKLHIQNVKKTYDEKEVLKNSSAVFEQGKIYGLLGRNGSGKTTLFNCISHEIPCEGDFLIEEHGELRKVEDKDIGYAYSSPILPEFMTGFEYIRFYMDIHAKEIDPAKTIDSYFDLMRIVPEDRHRLIKGYSHGMKNKLQMLGFLISRPKVILLDEPLTSFDVVVANEMKHLLLEMKEDHILIFSTHILQLASDLCDEIVLLHNGILEQLDHDLLQQSDFEDRIVSLLQEEAEHAE